MPTLDKIKTRISSIKSTSKITKAMELVATTKIKRAREKFQNTVENFNIVFSNISDIAQSCHENKSKYLNQKEGSTIWIVLSSDLGLCGSYNTNNFKVLRSNYKKGDKVFAIGQKALSLSRTFKIDIIKYYTQIISNFEFDNAKQIIVDVIKEFEKEDSNITSIKIIASRFINSVTFEAEAIQLIPIIIEQKNKSEKSAVENKEFEQKPTIILEKAISMFMGYALYSKVQEAKLIEQASRRLAMEAATKNANELLDELKIQYNQQRQANITQEISEIIAGANA